MWIVVEDDGKGLDKNKIFEKACSQGIVESSKNISDYTDKEIYAWTMDFEWSFRNRK